MAGIFWKKDSKITKIKEELRLKHKDCSFERHYLIIKERREVEDKKEQVLKELEPISDLCTAMACKETWEQWLKSEVEE